MVHKLKMRIVHWIQNWAYQIIRRDDLERLRKETVKLEKRVLEIRETRDQRKITWPTKDYFADDRNDIGRRMRQMAAMEMKRQVQDSWRENT